MNYSSIRGAAFAPPGRERFPLRTEGVRPEFPPPPPRSPEFIGEMDRLRAMLWARLALRINRPDPKEDRLLVITDAAPRLGVSRDWLYRNSSRLPFTVRVSERALRSSAKGIDRYIASRVGGRVR